MLYLCGMLKIIAGKKEYVVEFDGSNATKGELNKKPFDWDVAEIKANRFHVIKENRSYNVEVLEANTKEKKFEIKINGNRYILKAQDKFDELLKKMGIDGQESGKAKEIKAPMPGLVLEVMVKEGDEVKKDEPLMVLEAMKMENILKSPSDGKIKSIKVKKDVAVEKNEVLLDFE